MDPKQIKDFEDKVESAIVSVVEKQIPLMVDEKVAAKMEAAMEQLGLNKKGSDATFPLGMSDEQKAGFSQKQRFASLIKAVTKKDFKVLGELGCKGLIEGVDSQGGFLVPEEFASEVDRIKKNVGILRKLARRIPMTTDTMNMPVLGNTVAVQWVEEATEGTESVPTFKNVKLMTRTALGLAPVSNELLADANVDVVDFLMEIFAEALAEAEDFQGFNGVGTPFTGILNHPGVNDVSAAATHTTVATMTLKDFRSAQSIKGTILSGAVWVFSPSVWAAIQGIQENSQSVVNFSNNGNILSGDVKDGTLEPVGMLWDRPVYTSDQMPAVSDITADEAVGIFGNFNYFYFGDRQQMTLDVSKEASMTIGGTVVNAFASNQSIVRITERVALAVGIGEAFTVLKTAAA